MMSGEDSLQASASPWLRASEAAAYLRVGYKTLIGEVRAGRCRAARIGGRRQLMFKREWLDQAVEAFAPPVEVTRR